MPQLSDDEWEFLNRVVNETSIQRCIRDGEVKGIDASVLVDGKARRNLEQMTAPEFSEVLQGLIASWDRTRASDSSAAYVATSRRLQELDEQLTGAAPDVFIVFGGPNEGAMKALRRLLAALNLRVKTWDEEVHGLTHNFTIVERHMRAAKAVLVLVTPDEQVLEADGTIRLQPRPNVLAELGWAAAKHPERTTIIEVGCHLSASDFAGVNNIRIAEESFTMACNKLKRRLQNCDLAPQETTDEWNLPSEYREFFHVEPVGTKHTSSFRDEVLPPPRRAKQQAPPIDLLEPPPAREATSGEVVHWVVRELLWFHSTNPGEYLQIDHADAKLVDRDYEELIELLNAVDPYIIEGDLDDEGGVSQKFRLSHHFTDRFEHMYGDQDE